MNNNNSIGASLWTMYHDTDEFLAFEPGAEDDKGVAGAATRQWKKYDHPGYILKRLNAIKKKGIRREDKKRRRKLEKDDSTTTTTLGASARANTTTITPPRSGVSCVVVARKKCVPSSCPRTKPTNW